MELPKKIIERSNSPGEVIRHCLDEEGWTQDDLAQILSLSPKHVNEIIKDKRPLTLELLYNISTAFMFNEEESSDFAKKNTKFLMGKIDKSEEVQLKAELYKLLPIGELVKKGWINKQKDFSSYLNEINTTLNLEINSINDLKSIFTDLSENVKISYRNQESNVFTPSDNNKLTWYLYVKKKASEIIDLPIYQKSKLESLFNEISTYTNYKNQEEGISAFLNKLNDAGVKFLFLSHLSKTYTEGAAIFLNNIPTIVLTGRTNRIDTFWFNMAHEIVHILKEHYKEGLVIDGEESFSKDNQNPNEVEANEGAAKILKGDEIKEHFKGFLNYIPERDVIEFSELHNIHPSIIVGRLAWEGVVSFSIIHRFKDTVRDKIPRKYIFGE